MRKLLYLIAIILLIFGWNLIQNKYLKNENSVKKAWKIWKIKYNRTFPDKSVDKYFYEIFKVNYLKIEEINKNYTEKKLTYELEVNEYAIDIFSSFPPPSKKSEYKQEKNIEEIILEKQIRKNKNFIYQENNIKNGFENMPKSFDWRDKKNIITKVKNQQDLKCGSCWAFSTVGALESYRAIRENKLVDLSVQQLIDCVNGSNCK